MPQDQAVPKYTVLEKSLVGNEIYEAGAVVAYDGLPAGNLQPTCEEGERRAQEYLKSNEARVRKMQSDFAESAVGDPAAFSAHFAAELAKANADAAKAQADMMAAMPNMIAQAVAQALATAFPNGTAKPAAKPADPATPPADPLV